MTRDEMRKRVAALGLHGLVGRWDELAEAPWISQLVEGEEAERQRRSLARRLKNARIGAFKSIADFDWTWPRKVPRDIVEELLTLGFLRPKRNVVFRGPNGVGKTMITQNIAYQALLSGSTVCFTTASARISAGCREIGVPLIGKFSRARRVCTPQYAWAGTSTVPSESDSSRTCSARLTC